MTAQGGIIQRYIDGVEGLEVSTAAVADDPMYNGPPYYFDTGRSALRIVLTALIARLGYVGGNDHIRSILDFGSGYGRVTRWLRAAFPEALIEVTDLNRSAAKWCEETFERVSAIDVPSTSGYDVIFLGSVFTHLPAAAIKSQFDTLFACLKRNGVIVFTTMGRYAIHDAKARPDIRIYRVLPPGSVEPMADEFERSGFGFIPNPKTPEYGSTWVDPRWVISNLGCREDALQIMFQEKGWDNFQDAYAYLKAPLETAARSKM